ncbi:MAG: AMP-binding protein [Solirubrobacteraceae bacterium]
MVPTEASPIALRYGDQALSYAELESRTARLAAGLLEAGIASGDRVALFMPNCPELVISSPCLLCGGSDRRSAEHALPRAGGGVRA